MLIGQLEDGSATKRAKVQIVLRPGKDKAMRIDRHTLDEHFIEDEIAFEVYPSDFLEYCAPDEVIRAVLGNDVLDDLEGEQREKVLEELEAIPESDLLNATHEIREALNAGDIARAYEALGAYENPRWRSVAASQDAYNSAMGRTA